MCSDSIGLMTVIFKLIQEISHSIYIGKYELLDIHLSHTFFKDGYMIFRPATNEVHVDLQKI